MLKELMDEEIQMKKNLLDVWYMLRYIRYIIKKMELFLTIVLQKILVLLWIKKVEILQEI